MDTIPVPAVQRARASSNPPSKVTATEEPTPMATACKVCGHNLQPEDKYCGDCGTQSPNRSSGVRRKAEAKDDTGNGSSNSNTG